MLASGLDCLLGSQAATTVRLGERSGDERCRVAGAPDFAVRGFRAERKEAPLLPASFPRSVGLSCSVRGNLLVSWPPVGWSLLVLSVGDGCLRGCAGAAQRRAAGHSHADSVVISLRTHRSRDNPSREPRWMRVVSRARI